jgi:hypothetical protein
MLVNSASTFLSAEGGAFPMQHTGAGLLDMMGAVLSTIAAAPSSVDFGSGGSSANLSQRVVLKNVGRTADTFAVTVSPAQEGPLPTVNPDVVQLLPGATAEVTVRWNHDGLSPRAYEGFLVARGTHSDAIARIPYWYGTTGAPAASIAVFEAEATGRRSSRQDFLVRALDTTGLPVMGDPKVRVLSEGAGTSVSSVDPYDDQYPGFYRVQVNLSSERGANVFEIESGSAKVRVTITAE